MAQKPDIRVVVGAELLATKSVIEDDLKHVAKQINGGDRIPHVAVGIDVNASRALFEKQLKAVAKGLKVDGIGKSLQIPPVTIDTSKIVASLDRAVASMTDFQKASVAAAKSASIGSERRGDIQKMTDETVKLQKNIAKAYRDLGDLIGGRKISQKSALSYVKQLGEANENAFAWTDRLTSAEEKYFNAYKKRISQNQEYQASLDVIKNNVEMYNSTMGAGVLGVLKNVKGSARGFLKDIVPVEYIESTEALTQNIAKEEKTVESSNQALVTHAESMRTAVDAEAAKAAQSVKTARSIMLEEEAFDDVSEASDKSSKTITVNATKNIKAFEREITAQAKELKRLEGFELESVSAQRDKDDNITGMRLTYNNPRTGAVYQADYVAQIEKAEDGTEKLNAETITLEQTTSRIVKRQRDLTAEIQKTAAYRDREANKLAKRADMLYLNSLDPNAKKGIVEAQRPEFESNLKLIRSQIAAFKQSSKGMDDLKIDINEIIRLLDQYETKMKSSQNQQYAATQLAAKGVDVSREVWKNSLKQLENDFKNSGVISGDFLKDLSALKADDIVDADSLRKFVDQLAILRAKLKALKAEQKKMVSDKKWLSGRLTAIQGINVGATTGKNKLFDKEHIKQYSEAYAAVEKEINDAITRSKELTSEERAGISARISELRRYLSTCQQFEKTDVSSIHLDRYQSQIAEYQTTITNKVGASHQTYGAFEQEVKALSERYQELTEAVQKYNRIQETGAPDDDLRRQAVEVNRLDHEYQELNQTVRDRLRLLRADASSAGHAAMGYRDAQSLLKKMLNFEAANDKLWLDPSVSADFEKLKSDILALVNQDMDSGVFDVDYIQKLDGRLNQLQARLQSAGKAGKSFFGQLQDQLAKLGVYLTGSAIWNALNTAMRQMLQNVIEIDAAMTELKKVTNETHAAYERFLSNAAKRAGELGATLADVVTATADFARLGYGIDDASTLADAAIVYKNVGDGIDDISTASESIISIMKAFGIEAKDVMGIIDRLNAVGNSESSSSSGLGEALLRSASSLAAAGNTLDESIGLIVAANDVLQDPASTGTALKTLSMRLRNTAGELEELGEDSEGAATSITKLQTQLLNLTGGKVNIMLNDDEFKSTYQIMTELAAVWNELSDIAQADITRLVAGVRQGNAMNAIMTNMASAARAVTTSLNSSGSALEENAKYLDSINGRVSIFNAEWEELSHKSLDSDLVKNVVDFGTGVLSWTNNLGGLQTVLTAIIGLLIGGNIHKIIDTFTAIRKQFSGIAHGAGNLISTTGRLVKIFQHGSKAGRSFGSTLKLVASTGALTNVALGALALGVTALVVGIQRSIQKIQEMRQAAVESARTLTDSIASIEGYKSKIQELSDQLELGNLSEEEAYNVRQQLLGIQDEIIDKYGKEAKAVQLLTDETDRSIQKLDALALAKANAWEAENYKAINRARDTLNKNTTTDFSQYLTGNDSELVTILRSMGASETVVSGSGAYWSHTSDTIQAEIEWLTDLSLELARYGDRFEKARETISEKLSKLNDDEYTENYELVKSHFENKLITDTGYDSFYEEITNAQERYNEALASGDSDTASKSLKELYDLMQRIGTVADDAVDQHFFEGLFDNYSFEINSQHFKNAFDINENDIKSKVGQAITRIQDELSRQGIVLDDLSLLGAINSKQNSPDGGSTTAGVKALTELCEKYDITAEQLVDTLTELEYVQGKTFGNNSNVESGVAAKAKNAIDNAVRTYNKVIEEANSLFAEQELSADKLISFETFDHLTDSGSDLVDVLEEVRDETGNLTGWRIAEDAIESYISEQDEATRSTLKANGAVSDQYAGLKRYFGELGTAEEQITSYAEANEELGEAYKKAAKNEGFTYTEMLKLVAKYPELSFAIDNVTGEYKLNGQAALDLINRNYEQIKSLSELKLAYLELAAAQNFQATATASGVKRNAETAERQVDFLKQIIDEHDIQSYDEYRNLIGTDVKDSAWKKFIEDYTALKAQIEKEQAEIAELKAIKPEADPDNDSETSLFSKQKAQLDMERDALEAGRTLEDEYRQFRLKDELDYWDHYEQLVKDAYARQEIDAIEYQNHLNEIFSGRKEALENTNDRMSFDEVKRQLDLEKAALDAGYKLEDQYRKYSIDGALDYYDALERAAHDAYKRGEFDEVEYQEKLLEIHQGRADELAKTDSFESRKAQLDLEREALEAKFDLEDKYRKYGIESEKEYYEALKKEAEKAHASGELDDDEYLSIMMDAHKFDVDELSKQYADQLDAIETEKKKLEAGMVWDKSVIEDLDDFYDKYEKINEDRFRQNLITTEEYVDGQIFVFEGRKDKLNCILSDYQHDIDLLQNQNDSGDYDPRTVASNNASMISKYEMMQELVHKAAETYREEMSDTMSAIEIEHSDFIIELQQQWWDYQREIDRINEQIFSDALDSYKTYINNCNKFSIWRSDTEVDAYGRALDFLESSYQKDLITYERYLNEKIDLLGSMYDAEKDRQQAYVDAALRIMRKEREALEEELDKYEEQKSNYETAVSTVVDFIDERIKALREENKELDEQVKLQNALEEIERARSQKTKRVYVEGKGFQWMADEEAIKEAQEAYDDLRAESELEEQIEALEAYKKAWEDTIDAYEKGQNDRITAQILGNQWQKTLTDQMLSIVKQGSNGINYVRQLEIRELSKYATSYKSVCDQLDAKVEGSIANQIEDLDKLIKQWEDVIDDIEMETTQYEDLLEWATKFEGMSYEERARELEKFRDSSVSNLRQIQSAAEDATAALAALLEAQSKVSAKDILDRMTEHVKENVGAQKEVTSQGASQITDILQGVMNNAGIDPSKSESGKNTYEDLQDGLGNLNNNGSEEAKSYLDKLVAGLAGKTQTGTKSGTSQTTERKGVSDDIAIANEWIWDEITQTWYDKFGRKVFMNGGVVDYTGLAMVHGKPNHAETVFNAADSAKLYEYIHSVPNLVQDLISKVDFNPKIKKSGDTSMSIGNIHLHGVQNVDGLADAIVRTLPLKLAQKMGK